MTKQELYLKTIFCCIACDGEIVQEEIEVMKAMIAESSLFMGIEPEAILNAYVSEINKDGILFLKKYLNELSDSDLTVEEELRLVGLAIQMIEADNNIEYSEVKFFKKIRSRLSVSDEQILEQYPCKENFLLPDISVSEDPIWNFVTFTKFMEHE